MDSIHGSKKLGNHGVKQFHNNTGGEASGLITSNPTGTGFNICLPLCNWAEVTYSFLSDKLRLWKTVDSICSSGSKKILSRPDWLTFNPLLKNLTLEPETTPLGSLVSFYTRLESMYPSPPTCISLKERGSATLMRRLSSLVCLEHCNCFLNLTKQNRRWRL